jgi:hypothetical protein
MVSGYKNAVLNNDEIHHKLRRYSRYEKTKQIEAIQKYVRDKVPSNQFAEHYALKKSSKDLAELEREFRAQNRKFPDLRSQWFSSQLSINKTQNWEFGMSRFQYIPDTKLEGFGYFVWGYVGKDERIYPIILTEDHPSDTQARFPIVTLPANPPIKTSVNIGREQVLIQNYIMELRIYKISRRRAWITT